MPGDPVAADRAAAGPGFPWAVPSGAAQPRAASRAPGPPRSLYVHFPFCAHRCHYCDFSVKRAAAPPVGRWLSAIERELTWWFERGGWEAGTVLDTIFVGGGTPSLLGAAGMEELAERIAAWFRVDPRHTEWTVEANPASFDVDLGMRWRVAGVSRLSLGVQAFDDAVLAWLGRLHDRRRAMEAVREVKAAGFDGVSLDLLFGLPPEVTRDLAAEVETAVSLGVSHVSLYGLTVEPRTPLAEWIRLGRVRAPDENRYAAEYRLLSGGLRAAGYDHYEVSNFARPGAQCRHNWAYWNRTSYLAVGPSAHGFLPPVRSWNVFHWDRYERALDAGRGPLDGWERVGAAEEELERIWLDLRTQRGIGPGGPRLERWTEAGWLEERNGRWVATIEGWLRLDAIVAELAGAEGR
ncbi:radical SAM family heme chaperone HemW [Candidatus Palauibacter sp.]|uniref:radical SAM family heme chaperone HemW n=1 Tax=Candidatus Palauibacter sp. TaxID=3101350 RepID=UPI003B01AD08